MEFKNQLIDLADKILKLRDQLSTEESTKTALVLPFLQILGYDVFNPLEIVPEYVADVGVKKGEKVDYAVIKDNCPVILIECKHWKENLLKHNEQLFRYFNITNAKFGVLTNGIKYMFFTDLQQVNRMDESPFFEFDLTNIKDNEVEELKKFHKNYFAIDVISSTASELKYMNEIKNIFSQEIKEPSDLFVKFFASQVCDKRITEKVLENFKVLTKKSVHQVISDIITERLKLAISNENEILRAEESDVEENESLCNKIDTTHEELEAFFAIKALLRKKVSVKRIVHRDTISYFGILLDDNNRKPICRLYLNSSAKKYLALFNNEARKETKMPINSIDDIYAYAKDLEATIDMYEPK